MSLSVPWISFILYVSFVVSTGGTLSKGNKKKQKTPDPPIHVADEKYDESPLSSKEILEHHSKYESDTSAKHFPGSVLGYVTPWNNHGYNVAKIFGSKFSMVSPVWLQVGGD